jgi:hypothetical protein
MVLVLNHSEILRPLFGSSALPNSSLCMSTFSCLFLPVRQISMRHRSATGLINYKNLLQMKFPLACLHMYLSLSGCFTPQRPCFQIFNYYSSDPLARRAQCKATLVSLIVECSSESSHTARALMKRHNVAKIGSGVCIERVWRSTRSCMMGRWYR